MPKVKRTKTEKVAEAIDRAADVSETVKEFTPPEVDAMIDRGTQTAKLGFGIFQMLKGIFQKKQ